MKTLLFALLGAMPLLTGFTNPEDIPVYRLDRTIPSIVNVDDANSAMGMATEMMVLPTIGRIPEPEPAPGPLEPFCADDCLTFDAVATFEPKNGASSLVGCDTVRQGLAVAVAAWDEFQAGTATLRDLSTELAATTDATRKTELITQLNTLIAHLNELTRRIRTEYPSSYNISDRRVVFQWALIPSRILTGWPRSWVGQTVSLDLNEAKVRGYLWKKSQGTLTEVVGVDSLPSSQGRTLQFSMDATPVQICSEGHDVALAGYATLEFGIYDAALSAWRTNARTTLKAIFKGTPP